MVLAIDMRIIEREINEQPVQVRSHYNAVQSVDDLNKRTHVKREINVALKTRASLFA